MLELTLDKEILLKIKRNSGSWHIEIAKQNKYLGVVDNKIYVTCLLDIL